LNISGMIILGGGIAMDGITSAVGRSQSVTGQISPLQADMIGATLRPFWQAGTLRAGNLLPPLWHWGAFPPTAAMEDIGPDGHPRPGPFLPDLGLGRRMWAGGSLRFLAPLHVGEPLTRHSEIISLEHKQAGTTPMAVLTLRHRTLGAQGTAIEEEQTIVYLPLPDSYSPPKPVPAPDTADFDDTIPMDPVRLFRYSAVTFNGHRIHYDRAYATGVEHYPGLVVHGPLQATLLIEAATRHVGHPPQTFRYRGVHPMFDSHPLRLIGTMNKDDSMTLCTAAPAGHMGTQATAGWS
jgi:3-methylfumaryl-CoA hydratase